MAEIKEKEHYHELTDTQKKVVDELVNDPTAQNTQIAERADVARSTVYNVKEHYGEIIETQLNRQGRDPGEETAVGDPFDGELESETMFQAIAERPGQPSESGGGEQAPEVSEVDEADKSADAGLTTADGGNAEIMVGLNRSTARDVLNDSEFEQLREAVADALIDRAFAAASEQHE